MKRFWIAFLLFAAVTAQAHDGLKGLDLSTVEIVPLWIITNTVDNKQIVYPSPNVSIDLSGNPHFEKLLGFPAVAGPDDRCRAEPIVTKRLKDMAPLPPGSFLEYHSISLAEPFKSVVMRPVYALGEKTSSWRQLEPALICRLENFYEGSKLHGIVAGLLGAPVQAVTGAKKVYVALSPTGDGALPMTNEAQVLEIREIITKKLKENGTHFQGQFKALDLNGDGAWDLAIADVSEGSEYYILLQRKPNGTLSVIGTFNEEHFS